MSAVIPPTGNKIRQLDKAHQPDEQVTANQVQDPSTLARILMRIMADVAKLKRAFAPAYLDFEDHVFDGTGTTPNRFTHRLNGRVRWWVVDWTDLTGLGPRLIKHKSSDLNTLALVSLNAGTGTVRISISG